MRLRDLLPVSRRYREMWIEAMAAAEQARKPGYSDGEWRLVVKGGPAFMANVAQILAYASQGKAPDSATRKACDRMLAAIEEAHTE